MSLLNIVIHMLFASTAFFPSHGEWRIKSLYNVGKKKHLMSTEIIPC
jgi:hypothetical protein